MGRMRGRALVLVLTIGVCGILGVGTGSVGLISCVSERFGASASAEGSASPAPSTAPGQNHAAEAGEAMTSITITVNGTSFSAKLEDTEAARELAARLPLELRMSELNGNEKYVYLDEPLPTATERPGTIHAGDLMLFGDDCLVLFYESFRSGYSYTRVGRLDDPSGLAEAAGAGAAVVILA